MTQANAIIRWLANGQRGASSETMAFCALGVEQDRPYWSDHPRDPADFNRCLLLVCVAPEVRKSFSELAKLSPQWRAVIDHWDELESMFVEEAGLNWEKSKRARKTFARMCELFAQAEPWKAGEVQPA